MASGGEAEKLTAGGKERAVITKVGKRSDLGWESRGWKFTQEELSNPPSLKDNMLMSEEKEYRRKAHTFIQDSCQLLKTKALVLAAAQTICQRYFSQVSFRKIDRNDTAAAAIFLAAKVEEFRVHIKDVMMATHRVRHKGERRLVENSDEYNRYKERLLKAENQLVNALGFDFMIEHPFSHANDLGTYLREEGWVPADKSTLISKGSTHLLIKSLRGTMCLEHPPNFRARLVTYLSLLVNNIPPPPGGWADMIEFEDHGRLNRAACQLMEALDNDSGKTGVKITKKRLAAALIEAGHIKNTSDPDRVPRQPPVLTYADRDRMAARSSSPQSPNSFKRTVMRGHLPESDDNESQGGPALKRTPETSKLNGSAVPSHNGSSSHGRSSSNGRSTWNDRPSSSDRSSHIRPSSHGRSSSGDRPSSNVKPRPRPPSGPAPARAPTETGKRRRSQDATSNGNASRPRPPPPPPRTPHSSSSKPRPPTTPKPRPPSTPKPPGTTTPKPRPRPPTTPRPVSSNGQPLSAGKSSSTRKPSSSGQSFPRPPSTPKPNATSISKPTTPRPPSTPKPPSVPKTASTTPKPPSTPRPPSTPKPKSTATPLATPRPPSSGKAPRPPSTPHPDSLKKQPATTPLPSSSPRPPSKPHPSKVKGNGSATPPPPPPPKTSNRDSPDGKRRRDSLEEDGAGPSTDEPGSGGKRLKAGGVVNGNGTSDGSLAGGDAPDEKPVVSIAIGASAGDGAGKGKRSRDVPAEDESSEPGSGGKRSRKSIDWERPVGALKSASSAVIAGSAEDGEVEDGEIPIRAAVPV